MAKFAAPAGPAALTRAFCDAGADLVTCHVEADMPEKIHLALDKIHAKGKKACVVLKPVQLRPSALTVKLYLRLKSVKTKALKSSYFNSH